MIALCRFINQLFFLTSILPLYTSFFFFFNDPAPPEISTLPLPDALPISPPSRPLILPSLEAENRQPSRQCSARIQLLCSVNRCIGLPVSSSQIVTVPSLDPKAA